MDKEERRMESPDGGGDRLLTVEDVKDRLSVSRATVYNLLHAGALPSVTIGRSRRVRQSDVARFIAREGVDATSANR